MVEARQVQAEVMLEPTVDSLIKDSLAIISSEIAAYKRKIDRPNTRLELGESRVVQGYLKALVELSKEVRERAEDQDLANYSDEQLIKMLEDLKNKKVTP
jgi:hypothetical protein